MTELSEGRWAGEGHFTYIDNSTIIFIGAQGVEMEWRQRQGGLKKRHIMPSMNNAAAVLDTIKPREVCIMMGDLNANVGKGADLDCGIGPYGLGTRNNNGQKLAELCQADNLLLTDTLFCHH